MTSAKKRALYLVKRHDLSSKAEKEIVEELDEHFAEASDNARQEALEDAALAVDRYIEENIDEDDSSSRHDLGFVARSIRALKASR